MNKLIKDNQQGFTLIEIMIAITVFAIGILAVASMQISAIKGNSFASGMTEACTVAQDKTEEIMSLDYNDPKLNDTDGDGTNKDLNNDGVDDSGNDFGLNDTAAGSADGSAQYIGATSIQYNISWNIAVDIPVAGTKSVRVIVTWIEKGMSKNVILNSVKTLI